MADDMSAVDTTESLSTLGLEVRQLRKARQMTLAALAKASSVSVSHLSAIERGTVNPSLDKVSKIAAGLGVPEAWFFTRRSGAGQMERAYVVRRGNRRNLNLLYEETVEQSGYADALLSSSIGGSFYMGMSAYPPNSDQVIDHLYEREGEHHGFVLEGKLELYLVDETITLRQGDSYSFPGHLLHRVRNASDRPARLIWVNAPVIMPKYAALKPAPGSTVSATSTAQRRSGG